MIWMIYLSGHFIFDFQFPWIFPELRKLSMTSWYSILAETEIIKLNLRSGKSFKLEHTVKIPRLFPDFPLSFSKFPNLSLTISTLFHFSWLSMISLISRILTTLYTKWCIPTLANVFHIPVFTKGHVKIKQQNNVALLLLHARPNHDAFEFKLDSLLNKTFSYKLIFLNKLQYSLQKTIEKSVTDSGYAYVKQWFWFRTFEHQPQRKYTGWRSSKL